MRAERTRTANNGFTLVEVLAGMLFMAIVLPVAIEGITLAHRVGVVADKKREAARIAQSILDDAVATESWRDGDRNEDVGNDWPGFSYHLSSIDWTETGMTSVTVEVTFKAFGRDYSVSLATLAQTDTGGTQSGTSTSISSSGSSSSSSSSSSTSSGTAR
ncbi:type II secretion system GspH family protein [bacterium]|nr:type II secretion system GspH family protein [bacterium]